MYESTIEDLEGGRVRLQIIARADRPMSYAQVISGWCRDPDFRAWFISLLAESPYPAYFWETPPVSLASRDQPFEFVLVDSPRLAAATPERRPFESYFSAAGPDETVVSFPNLGGDAFLIVPCPCAALSAYPHLGAFTREAPLDQQHALWSAAGAALEERLGATPVWVSTAGLGVFWVHLRLDSRPKYYSYAPYRVTARDAVDGP